MKKILLIVSALIVILGIGAGVYFYMAARGPSISVAPLGGTLPVAGNSEGDGSDGASGTVDSGTNPDGVGSPVVVTSRLVQISAGPVVPGEIVLNTASSTASSSAKTSVQFIEQESGNVFSYAQNTHVLTRINNKTLPGIQSATWLPNGSAALVQYLSGTDFSTVNTYSLAASSSDGFFLPQDLTGVAVSANNFLTLASGVNGSSVSLTNTDGTHSSALFTTPLSSVRVSFAGKNQYLAFSKPSGALPGDAFLVNSKGHFLHMVGPLNGLVALSSPSGKWALVSYTLTNALHTELVDTLSGEVIALPLNTIADKCVWSSDESSIYCGVPQNLDPPYLYPDDWYQGAVHFSDRIWKIDVSGRYAQLTLDFGEAQKGTLDATALAIDPAKSTLVFLNKNDGSLWSYSL